MSIKTNYLDVDVSNDFGFTFEHEEDIVAGSTKYASVNDEVADLKNRLHALRKIFMPLLQNLAKEPEKTMIKWPNRAEVIEKQMKRLTDITSV